MTREDAIYCLKGEPNGKICCQKCRCHGFECWKEAESIAIQSLRAWDEVLKEIKSFQEETKNPVYKLAFGSCLVSIEEHLKEVEK